MRPFTVLIGPNGAGKDDDPRSDRRARTPRIAGTIKDLLEAKSWEYGDLPHLRAATKQLGIKAELALDGTLLSWSLSLGAKRRPGISHEAVVMLRPTTARPIRPLLERTGRRMRRWAADGTVDVISQTLTSSWLSSIDDEDRHRLPRAVRGWRAGRGEIRGYFFLDPLKLRVTLAAARSD